MTDDRQRWPEPPDPELQALFDAARTPPTAPADARDRVLARVAATIGAAPTPTGDPLSAGAPATSSGTASTGAASTGAGASAGAAGTASVAVATGGSAWAVALAGLLAVGLAGGIWLGLSGVDEAPPAAQAEARIDPPSQADEGPPTLAPTAPARGSASSTAPVGGSDPGDLRGALESDEQPPRPARTPRSHAEPRPSRRRPTTRSIRERAPAPAPAAAARPAVIDPPPTPAPAPAPAPAPDPRADAPTADTALAAERGLLLDALHGLEAADLPAARRALDAHRRRFPAGRLADERALLRIRWLLAADRPAEARRAADAFRARAPGSLLRPAVDALVAP